MGLSPLPSFHSILAISYETYIYIYIIYIYILKNLRVGPFLVECSPFPFSPLWPTIFATARDLSCINKDTLFGNGELVHYHQDSGQTGYYVIGFIRERSRLS